MIALIGAVISSTTVGVAAPPSLHIWYATDDPTEPAMIAQLAQSFRQAHPGVVVDLHAYALDDFNIKMQLALASGSPPDLIYATPRGPALPTYARDHRLMDLASIAATQRWMQAEGADSLAAYNDALSPTGQAHGRVYAVPYVQAAVAVLYNPRIFQRLHLSVPRTLAQFDAVCAAVHKAGLTALGFGNADGWMGDDWYLTLVNSLVDPLTLRGEQHLQPRFSFTTPPFLQAAAHMQQWASAGFFTPQFGGLDAQDSILSFFHGTAAMQLISSSENGQILTLAGQTGLPIGVFAFPSASTKRPPVAPQSGYEGWAIPTGSRQSALAAQFIGAMLTQSTARILVAHGLLPVVNVAVSAAALPFQSAFIRALHGAEPGYYLDGAPVPNLNATMEANVQLLLQNIEPPSFLVHSLQMVYSTGGRLATSTRTDGEF